MSLLDITVWPIDHTDTRMISRSISHMRWSTGREKTIAQFDLSIGSPMAKPKERALIMKVLKNFDSPELPDFKKVRTQAKGNVFVAEPQFSLHEIPDLDTEGFEAFQEFTNRYGGMFLDYYPSDGVDLNSFNYKLEYKVLRLNDRSRKLGTVHIYSESLALLFLRDLKAMSRHIIALSNEGDEVAPWKEAGYEIPRGKSGLIFSRNLLKTRLDAGLRQLRMFSIFDDLNKEHGAFDTQGFVRPGIFSIVCFQLYTYHQQHRPISRCAYKSCGLYFSITEGYGSSKRSNRSDSIYCSERCARNASQKRYRERLKQGAKS